MTGHHSIIQRGLSATRSLLAQGRFGRMFRNTPPAQFGRTEADNIANLSALADRMSAGFDPPKDGPDAEESGIPALYTYLGQFIDHDITYDPVSLLTKSQDPDGLVDFRTPALDLDNVYGRGPSDQPYIYDGLKFRLGDTLKGQDLADANDLPRFGGRALIGDPRNDENSIVSQLQSLFLRFHNRMVDDNPGLGFESVQERVRFHYQYIVLNDFLPRIISAPVLGALKTGSSYDQNKMKFFHWHNTPFMPVEFSVAAYRLGHSMIRPGYRLNSADDMLLPIFPVGELKVGLTGFQTMAVGRAIDWGRFIDIDNRAYGGDGEDAANKLRLQFAYRIDASLVSPLKKLPDLVASDPPPSLGLRNLERGWRLRLPSGQAVAKAMQINPLDDSDILIGKAVDVPDPGEEPVPIDQIANGAFAKNCPLWTYVLAEAAHQSTPLKIPVTGPPKTINTPQLGPVGGRIVAEVILGLIFGDPTSMLSLDPQWKPVTGPDFALKDFVAYALGQGPSLH
ncbi:heme peroxidase family protein [Methylocapsa sp. D3K7]|uniref:peroxidase family protein n=1 Tax=Methylocapsa sp. D3K7 TaxID=3041435 RepID=UPI00244E836C|nr:heme peroxidase family protein [Methylocapsa sp. D3K7]WGJ13540.1 heme peroxidase family protein [Methylocapsa sp. D3K7]